MSKLLQPKKHGFVMPLAVLAVLILSVTGLGLLSLGLQSRVFAAKTASEIAARCAADAGLTMAVFEMNQRLKDGTWDSNSLPQSTKVSLPNCDATFSYTVERGLDSGYVVACVGNSGRTSRTVSATLRLRGLFDYGILAEDTITLKSGTIVDGYDSANPSDGDVPVQIATTSSDNGAIDLSSGATVDGEVLVGIDGYFPTVTPPPLADMGTIEVGSGTLTISTCDNGKYSSIHAGQGTTLKVDGGGEVILHVTGNIDLGQGSELIIQPGTSLVIYLDGDLYARNSAGINNATEDSTNFVLYGTGEDQIFDLKAKSEWYGAIYAPNADIIIRADADVYGSFVTSNFQTQGGGSHVYYDAALRNVSETDVAVYFAVDRWQEQ